MPTCPLPEKTFNSHPDDEKKVLLGKITSVHGLRGWIKIYSWTQPKANIFGYGQWWLCFPDNRMKKVTVEQTRSSGNNLVARIKGCHDRDQARFYVNANILVDESMLPDLDVGEYYWHQLKGLTVFIVTNDNKLSNIGKIHHLVDTGANDVIVVRPTPQSIDERERWIPWLEEQTIIDVDLARREIQVNWDPEF